MTDGMLSRDPPCPPGGQGVSAWLHARHARASHPHRLPATLGASGPHGLARKGGHDTTSRHPGDASTKEKTQKNFPEENSRSFTR